MKKRLLWILLVLALIMIGEHSNNTLPEGVQVNGRYQVDPGIWNGPTASLYVDDYGATVVLPCAQGMISDPLILNEKNEFRSKGAIQSDFGSSKTAPEPVEFSGVIKEGQMILRHHSIESAVGANSISAEETHELIFEGPNILMRCE